MNHLIKQWWLRKVNLPRSGLLEPLHSPDGKKRGGAEAAKLGGPLVMQVVGQHAIIRTDTRFEGKE